MQCHLGWAMLCHPGWAQAALEFVPILLALPLGAGITAAHHQASPLFLRSCIGFASSHLLTSCPPTTLSTCPWPQQHMELWHYSSTIFTPLIAESVSTGMVPVTLAGTWSVPACTPRPGARTDFVIASLAIGSLWCWWGSNPDVLKDCWLEVLQARNCLSTFSIIFWVRIQIPSSWSRHRPGL